MFGGFYSAGLFLAALLPSEVLTFLTLDRAAAPQVKK